MCFQMGPLGSIFLSCLNFTIRLKWVYLYHFIPKSVILGERVQTALATGKLSLSRLFLIFFSNPCPLQKHSAGVRGAKSSTPVQLCIKGNSSGEHSHAVNMIGTEDRMFLPTINPLRRLPLYMTGSISTCMIFYALNHFRAPRNGQTTFSTHLCFELCYGLFNF